MGLPAGVTVNAVGGRAGGHRRVWRPAMNAAAVW